MVVGNPLKKSAFLPPFQNQGKWDTLKLLAQATGHWKIENALHYRKDASMGEDRCYARKWPTISLLATIRSLVTTVLGRRKESLPCV
ncbi:MAG: hypothetical protein J6386_22135 [Candidatus Synoicihabitans palmerolidicus]|nr:hypothetical protein [Candidatus Synoicihabitans palmerolidicus]